MKFDIVVGNPPYGMRTDILHLKIMKNSLSFCKYKLTFIMPSKPIIEQLEGEWYDVFRNAVCHAVDIVSKETFPNTEMYNTAIFYCNRKEKKENYCKRLDVDRTLYNAIPHEAHRLYMYKMNVSPLKITICYGSKNTKEEEVENVINNTIEGKYYLNVNRANGSMGAIWISNALDNVDVLDRRQEIEFCKQHKATKNIIECPNKIYGQNLKRLLKGNVLRYGLWLMQTSQAIGSTKFRYVPDIDYTNITTDEELLRECGFTKGEIEKVLDYLSTFDFSKSRNDSIRDYEV